MASKRVSKEFKEEFVEQHINHEAVSLAVENMESMGVEGKELQPLKALKQTLSDALAKSRNRVLKSMTLSDNTVHLKDSWYGVRFYDSKDNPALHVDLINGDDLHILKRDCREERELSERDIDSLMPACRDLLSDAGHGSDVMERMREYMPKPKEIEVGAVDTIVLPDDRSFLEYEVSPSTKISPFMYEDENGVPQLWEGKAQAVLPVVTVSYHAGGRYVQRILGLAQNSIEEAEQYFKHNFSDMVGKIRERYAESEQIWSDEDEDIRFNLGADNLVFVEGNRNIITLYEPDFGFSKDINRLIIMQQVEVLKESKAQVVKHSKAYKEVVEESDRELDVVNDEIKLLKSKLVRAQAIQNELISNKERARMEVEVAEDSFTSEYNKLFKKWKTRA